LRGSFAPHTLMAKLCLVDGEEMTVMRDCECCGSVVRVMGILIGGILETGEEDEVEGLLCERCADAAMAAWTDREWNEQPAGGAVAWYRRWLKGVNSR